MRKRIQRLRRQRLDSRIPHIRYNTEIKPRAIDDTSHDSEHVVKFNFVVLAKDPRVVADDIIAQMRQYDDGLNLVVDFLSERIGKGLAYLVRSVETNVRPDLIDWIKYGLPFKRDKNLKEHPGITLADYVAKTYL